MMTKQGYISPQKHQWLVDDNALLRKENKRLRQQVWSGDRMMGMLTRMGISKNQAFMAANECDRLNALVEEECVA